MYDTCTLAFSKTKHGWRPSWIDIWHVDPERSAPATVPMIAAVGSSEGPKEYGDAVEWLLKHREFVLELETILARRASITGLYGHTFRD